ncbi:4-sulfomuconolactone hydrolase [Rhynchospora pubera]|uniref:4-sulfomuconolactone hydrolase n=1 Tax=Rhynchospora pubera TaxID=906938 RepID=A0AAV8HGE5_9POAL|nr:4-sulfomuconolactone hydrolase [Rhynchospora pubera]
MAKLLSLPLHQSPAPIILSKARTLFRYAKPSHLTIAMASNSASSPSPSPSFTVFDSHLHVWATPDQASEKYPYFPGQEPTLRGDVDFLLECMDEAGVEGALIVQPINYMFDHSYVTSVLKKYPSKFLGCLLANPADDGSGIKQLEELVLRDDYCAVRFNPYLWPSSQKMTNKVGKALFAKAGELGVPVGFMLFKGLNLHIEEVEELCTEYPETKVILDHVSFCRPPSNEEEEKAFSSLLQLSRFPQVHLKFSALFRVSREKPPYEDLASVLSQLIANFGSNRIMWGSDFPFVVPESGYKGALEAAKYLSDKVEREHSSGLDFSLGGNHLFLKK